MYIILLIILVIVYLFFIRKKDVNKEHFNMQNNLNDILKNHNKTIHTINFNQQKHSNYTITDKNDPSKKQIFKNVSIENLPDEIKEKLKNGDVKIHSKTSKKH